MDMETNRAMEVVGIGVPYYDMVINVSKMPGLDGAAGANEAFYQGGGKVATAMAAAARLGRRASRYCGQGATIMLSQSLGIACQISSVINGIIGCRSFKHWFMT